MLVLSFTIIETLSNADINCEIFTVALFGLSVGMSWLYFGYWPSINLDIIIVFSDFITSFVFSVYIFTVSSSINELIFKNSIIVFDGIINWAGFETFFSNFSLSLANLFPSVDAISKVLSEISQTTPESILFAS